MFMMILPSYLVTTLFVESVYAIGPRKAIEKNAHCAKETSPVPFLPRIPEWPTLSTAWQLDAVMWNANGRVMCSH